MTLGPGYPVTLGPGDPSTLFHVVWTVCPLGSVVLMTQRPPERRVKYRFLGPTLEFLMQEARGQESVFPTSSQLPLLLVWGPHPENHPFNLASPLSPGKGHYCCLWKSLRSDADSQAWGRDRVEAGAGVLSCC